MERPKCSQCKHFYITWDPKTPNGCRQFGIQSKDLPSNIVAAAGSGECKGYEAKKAKPTSNSSVDYGN